MRGQGPGPRAGSRLAQDAHPPVTSSTANTISLWPRFSGRCTASPAIAITPIPVRSPPGFMPSGRPFA
jgi:hypothetical protein